ncbi:NADH dehydrogenase [ubiquinone] 1 alpha subcomplex subunit 12 [Dillenia turbinata]|uniref:NADH dehydrogenase [ubiquinone] 1 alpha subcomplex subunit 12 n=1 Tax=Dillenia turbinata TaxID=194707 RepID=A0AAN8ZHG5_9MAGN
MSKIWQRLTGYLSNRTLVGVDKAGNRYFTRKEEIDVKEKRWIIFKGEEDPTTIPVLKKEEEEWRAKESPSRKGKVGGPDLRSFIQQFPSSLEGIKSFQSWHCKVFLISRFCSIYGRQSFQF